MNPLTLAAVWLDKHSAGGKKLAPVQFNALLKAFKTSQTMQQGF